jgi:tetratricopeptide (TPR) repeat protein
LPKSRFVPPILQGALAFYTRALELQPNDAEVNLGIGGTFSQLRRPSEALSYLQRSAELEPSRT